MWNLIQKTKAPNSMEILSQGQRGLAAYCADCLWCSADSQWGWRDTDRRHAARLEREFFIDNLLVRIHLIVEMIIVDRPGAMRV